MYDTGRLSRSRTSVGTGIVLEMRQNASNQSPVQWRRGLAIRHPCAAFLVPMDACRPIKVLHLAGAVFGSWRQLLELSTGSLISGGARFHERGEKKEMVD